MERGSNKHSPELDDQLKGTPSGHRISGSGSSADEYTYKDWGEVGGKSHPKPKNEDERSERAQQSTE